MSIGGFDRLLYTGCRAGTGRGAGGGFQIQAQSSGTDAAQADMAVGWLLYEAQNNWITQRRPVEEFPPGFAHACGAGYGTAQGRYVGKEATGGRQGNHLTDCLLTRDPDLYGATRPAQLWLSELWRAEPWDTTECPPFTGEPVPGPLTVGAIADWLRDRPERAPVLERLLSVLGTAEGRRVLIVATDAAEAMRWIAAATLLMPMRLALEVSFKVFSANPARAGQRIIAVPRDLNPRIAPRQGEPSFVLDADACAADDAEVSGRAHFLVGHLASNDDPYDVVDAVELADVLVDHPGDPGNDRTALLTAWAITRPSDPVPEPAVLFGWLSNAGPALLREHGGTVAGILMATGPSASVLRWIDAAAGRGLIDLEPPPVRTRLFAAELAETRDGTPPPAERLPEVTLDAEIRRDADSDLSSAIVLSPSTLVEPLLRLAQRHGIQPTPSPPLRDRLIGFARDWVEDKVSGDPGTWACREMVLDATYDELHARLDQHGVRGISAPLRRLFRYFTDRQGDPVDPLDRHLNVAALTTLPAEYQLARVEALLKRVLAAPAAATVAGDLQSALVEWDAARPEVAAVLLARLPVSIPLNPEIAKRAIAWLESRAGHPDTDLMTGLDMLRRRRLMPKSGPLPKLVASNARVTAFIEGAASDADGPAVRKAIDRLKQAGPAVIRVRLDDLLPALMDSPCPELGGAVLVRLDTSLSRELIERWAAELGGPRAPRAVMWGIDCSADPDLPQRRYDQLVAALHGFTSKLTEDEFTRWRRHVEGHLGKERRQMLANLLRYEAPRDKPRRTAWMRRGGGR